jgi:hypothetical protein
VRPFKSARGSGDPPPVRPLAALALAAALAAPAAPAGAEIYRCQGPDGKTVYSSDPAACPGTLPHAPERSLQRVGGGSRGADPAAPAPAGPQAEDGAQGEDAQAAMWKRKRLEAEAELRDLDRNLPELKEVVSWCNRGGELVLEDKVGVREDYSCDEALAAYEKLGARQRELRRYLASGLADECRRAGCLPGWIR